MRTSSTYIPIDKDFALLEFEYNSKVISTKDSNFLRIKNTLSGSINYVSYNPLNYTKVKGLTGNVIDVTAQQISENDWVHLDIDRPLKYFEQQNNNLIFEDLWNDIIQELYITYNTLKIHILSGYTFDDIAGLIARISYVDNNYNQIFVSNVAYLKEETINYHSHPLQIGDKVYDRYVSILFPTLKDLKDVDTQISNKYKDTDKLFYYKNQFPNIDNSKVNIVLYEVNKITTNTKGQLILETVLPLNNDSNGITRREVNINDAFSSISAIIQESNNGDYFELFPTYEGEFLEDYLQQRAQFNNENYMVIHDIDLYEQQFSIAGYSEIKTQSFTQIQDSNFSEPFKYRPIILNTNTIAFTVDYTIRLYNQTNPSHIIRRASLTYPNAKKYGRFMSKIDIPLDFQPMKIVNKILLKDDTFNQANVLPTFLLSNNKETSYNYNNEQYIPINYNNIVLNSNTLFFDKVNDITNLNSDFSVKNLTNSDVIYGQGDGVLYLNEFDNFIKFKIYKKENNKLETYNDISDYSNNIFYLNFEASNGTLIKIKQENQDNILNMVLENGEVFFKIDSISSKQILNSNINKFWLTLENNIVEDNLGNVKPTKKNFETVIYTGYIDNIVNYSFTSNNDITFKNSLLESNISKLEVTNDKLNLLKGDLNDIKKKLNIDEKVSEEYRQAIQNYITQIDNIIKQQFEV